MHSSATLFACAAAVLSTAAYAQQAPSAPAPGKSSPPQESQSAASKADYAGDDCRKDMENAEEAKRAGHITEKEYAEQRKMAQTKLKRDAGQSGAAQANADCK